MKSAVKVLSFSIFLLLMEVSFAGDCGDVNYSGTVNALDITYLINYLYKHGPTPNCGPETGTVTDIDGNIYHTIKIGNQWWMVENLKVSRYRNGDSIPRIADNTEWASLSTGASCEYDNNSDNIATYGRLYNWFAASDARNIAPLGWHLPSHAEWQALSAYLGGDAVAGGKLKESGISHWLIPNTGATNESGFTGLPSGYRHNSGYFYDFGSMASFWSYTEYDGDNAWRIGLQYDNSEVRYYITNEHYGASIRCVKD